jgi:hypothetical protein
MSRKASLGLLIILTAVVVCVCCRMPRFAQPLSYHLFADRRAFLGIPNSADVASNLPFAAIGIGVKSAAPGAPCPDSGTWESMNSKYEITWSKHYSGFDSALY